MLRQATTSALKQQRSRTGSLVYNATRRRFASEATEAQSELGPCFNLSEEQQAFQDLARQFTKEQITPVAAEHDRTMQVSSITAPIQQITLKFPIGLSPLLPC